MFSIENDIFPSIPLHQTSESSWWPYCHAHHCAWKVHTTFTVSKRYKLFKKATMEDIANVVPTVFNTGKHTKPASFGLNQAIYISSIHNHHWL